MREATIHYRRTAGGGVAAGLVGALHSVLTAIADRPGAGSPLLGLTLNRPGLRSWSLPRYPYLVFYQEFEDRIEVVRVLHGRRDIASLLGETS